MIYQDLSDEQLMLLAKLVRVETLRAKVALDEALQDDSISAATTRYLKDDLKFASELKDILGPGGPVITGFKLADEPEIEDDSDF